MRKFALEIEKSMHSLCPTNNKINIAPLYNGIVNTFMINKEGQGLTFGCWTLETNM